MKHPIIKLLPKVCLLLLSLVSCNAEQLGYKGSQASSFEGIKAIEYEGSNLFTARWPALDISEHVSIEYDFYTGSAESLNQELLSTALSSPIKSQTILSNQNEIQITTIQNKDLTQQVYSEEPKSKIQNSNQIRFSLEVSPGKYYYAALRTKVGGEVRDSENYGQIYMIRVASSSFHGIESIKVATDTDSLQINWTESNQRLTDSSIFYQTFIWSPTSSAFKSYLDSLTSEPIYIQEPSEETQNGKVLIYTIEDQEWLPKNHATSTESVVSSDRYVLTQTLALDQTHAFQVETTDGSLATNRIATISFLAEPLTGFTGLTSVQKTDTTSVQLGWQLASNSEVSGYNIYRGANFATLVGSVDQSTSSFSITELSETSTETFGVKATDAYGHQDSNLSLMSIVLEGAEVLTSPSLKAVPTSHNFGQVKIGGTASSKTFTILNSGGATNLSSFSVSNSSVLSISEDSCSGQTLQKDASCSLTISFAPTSLGELAASVYSKFATADGNDIEVQDFSFAITGEGVANVGDFAGVSGYTNLDKTSVDITWSADSLASQYNIYSVENGTQNLLQNISAPATSASLSGLTASTAYTIQVLAVDSAGLIAQNDSTVTFTTLSNSGFKVSRLGGSLEYKYTWSNVSASSGSTFTITKKIGSTPPTTVETAETVISGLANTETSYTSPVLVAGSGDVTPVSFTLFNCSGSCTASYSVTIDGSISTTQNNSEGSTFKLEYSTSDGQTPVLGWSNSKSTIESWNGIDSITGLTEVASGATNCTSPSTTGCSVDLSSEAPWQQRYFRLSVPSTDESGAYLSEIFAYARVPDGMVYIDAESWQPEDGLTYEDHETFSFAIDKYQIDSSYQSLESSIPVTSVSWTTLKSSCAARTAVGFTATNPWRKVHLENGLEYTAASYGTPDTSGQGYCNTDNRGDPAAANETGTNDNSGCISYFGARNMIGNIWEFSDEVLDERNWKIFYGTTAEEAIPVPIISETSATTEVKDWNRHTAMPSIGTRSGPWSGSSAQVTQNWGDIASMFTSSGARVVIRNGPASAGATVGRFNQYLAWGPSSSGAQAGGRCALIGPGPGRIQFHNDSNGSLARFKWRLWAEESITTVKIGFAKTLAGIEAWDGTDQGSSISDDLYTIDNFSECSDTSYNSEDKTTQGDGTTTSGAFGLKGRCGLNLASLTAWEKRYVKLYASNSYRSITSAALVYGKVPDGMVFVSSDDWPDKDKHQTANEIGEEYSSPFDFAIDKYPTSANGTVNDCSSDDFPCTAGIGGGYLESVATTPIYSIDWFTHKEGCDARTAILGSTWADTSALPGSTTGRRVHLMTGLEFTVASFETPKSTGPDFCMFESSFWNPSSYNNYALDHFQNCTSRYGVNAMIGTNWEFTNDIAHNTMLLRYYDDTSGTGEDVGLSGSWSVGDGYNTTWDFDQAMPTATTANAVDASFGVNYFSSPGAASGWGSTLYTQLRGGVYGSGEAAGRFNIYHKAAPTTQTSWVGRCALRAP